MPEKSVPKKEYFTPEHYQAIGEFVTHYGMLESMFHSVFDRYSGISTEMRRAIIAGARLKDVIERTKRVMKINGHVDALKDIELAEERLNPLSTFRDKIVHRVWLPNELGPALVNLSGGKTAESALVPEIVTTEQILYFDQCVLALTIFLCRHALQPDTNKRLWEELAAICSRDDLKALASSWLRKSHGQGRKK